MKANKEQMDKMMMNMMNMMSDSNKMMQDTMDTMLQSATVMTKGYQEIFDNMTSMSRNWMEQGMKASETMMGAKDINSIMTTQSSLLQNTLEAMMNDMNHMSQISSRVVHEAAEPMANHVNATMNSTMNMVANSKAA